MAEFDEESPDEESPKIVPESYRGNGRPGRKL
jgi:hypothetical protein